MGTACKYDGKGEIWVDPRKKLGLFFLIYKFGQFSLKTNFMANYCLIYKHQFQLHHHDTQAL